MLVSVIIPMHNAEETIDILYMSLCRSSYKNLEIVFVDNASTDRSYEKVRGFQVMDPRVKLFREEKLGVTYARKRGFQESTGEYVYFIDADDYVAPKGIENMVRAAETEDADIVRGHFCNMYGKDILYVLNACTKPVGNYRKHFDGPSTESFHAQNVPLWIILYKRSLIKDYYFVNLQQGEDLLFNLYAYAEAKRVVDIPSYVYIYIRHGNGLSATPNLTDAYRLLNECGKIAIKYAEQGILESHQMKLEQFIIQRYLVLYSLEYIDAMRNFSFGRSFEENCQRMNEIDEILEALKAYSNPLIRKDRSDCEMLMRTNTPFETEYQEVREKRLTQK